MKQDLGLDNQQAIGAGVMHDVSRRRFLQFAGGLAGAGLIVSSCHKTENTRDITTIGRGDIALINYLYIVEVVLTAFYTQMNNTQYYGLTESELQLQADMRDHQYAHRELLKKILGRDAIEKVVPDLSPATFADRNSTLTNAIFLDDLAVAAYNGVAQYFADTNYVLLAAKMGTVKARHASYVRNIHAANTLSDATVVNNNGLDRAMTPKAVMEALAPYLQTKVDVGTLPA